jgi:hypothetical protein
MFLAFQLFINKKASNFRQMFTIERYCNKCEERLTNSRSKRNGLMIFYRLWISNAFSMAVDYPTMLGPIRKKNPTKLQFLKVKSDNNANFLGGVGGCHRILDSNGVVI